MQQIAERLQAGESVTCTLKGNSMTPIIRSGDTVTIEPVDITDISKGDIVFCKVRGRYYLHKVTAIQGDRLQISNNHGHVNGWTKQVFGTLKKD